jgi:hypothetical protein
VATDNALNYNEIAEYLKYVFDLTHKRIDTIQSKATQLFTLHSILIPIILSGVYFNWNTSEGLNIILRLLITLLAALPLFAVVYSISYILRCVWVRKFDEPSWVLVYNETDKLFVSYSPKVLSDVLIESTIKNEETCQDLSDHLLHIQKSGIVSLLLLLLPFSLLFYNAPNRLPTNLIYRNSHYFDILLRGAQGVDMCNILYNWQSLIGSFLAVAGGLFVGLYIMYRTFDKQDKQRNEEKEKESLLLYLTNFVNRYSSIENTLLYGVNISSDDKDIQTVPLGVGNNSLDRDNLFSNLDIIYSIYNMIKEVLTKGVATNVVGVSYHYNSVKDRDKQIVYCENLKVGLYNVNRIEVLIKIINSSEYVCVILDSNHKHIAKRFVENVIEQQLIMLIKIDYYDEIRNRILFDLNKIYEKDVRLRSLCDYPIKTYNCFEAIN